MKRALITFIFTLPLLLLGATSTAFAAENEPARPEPSDAHLRGVEIALRPTIGGVGADSPVTADASSGNAPAVFRSGSAPFGLAAGVSTQVGWRFHPLVSAGFRFDLGRVSADSPNDGTKELERETMGAGLYSRIYPLALNETMRRHFDPWLGVGAAYAHDVVTFTQPTPTNAGNVDVKYQADRHAIAIPLGIGIDYRATEWLSIGPSFEYVLMDPIVGCVKASTAGLPEEKICSDDGKNGLVASSAGAWNAGLMLRVTPF
jgi:hypothetical protein